jgi:hypothetical protein
MRHLGERFEPTVLAMVVSAIRTASRQKGRDLRAAAYKLQEDGVDTFEHCEAYVGQVFSTDGTHRS